MKYLATMIVFSLILISCKHPKNDQKTFIDGTNQEISAGSNLFDMGIYVVDIERSKEFYTSVFDLKADLTQKLAQ